MGRKSKDRPRKPRTEKTEAWMWTLLPKVQDIDLDKLTMDELSAYIGKSKSTIYEYFQTKEEILLYLAQVVMEPLAEELFNSSNKGSSSKDEYIHVIEVLGRGLAGVSTHLLEQMKGNFPTVWMAIDNFIILVLDKISKIYKSGMNAGEFQKYNIDLLLALDRHFVSSIITHASDSIPYEQVNLLIEEYLNLRLGGLKKT